MSCRACRHYRRSTETTLAEITGELRHLPGIQAAGEHQRLGLCGLRLEYVDPTWRCEHYSSRVLGAAKRWVALRRGGVDPDVALRARLAKEAAADAERRALERAKAERRITPGECRTCGRLHNRCGVCKMPVMACGICPTCRVSLTVLRTDSGHYWRCSNCVSSGEGIPELPGLPEGVCDGCRASVTTRGNA